MKIIEDLKAYSNGSIFKVLSTLVFDPGFHCVFNYRIANLFYKLKLSPISKVIWYMNRLFYSVDIDYRANLAGGFVVIHGIGLVVGAFVTTKGKTTVYQGVTLGGNSGKTQLFDGQLIRQPFIGENVIIFSNSTLLGPIIIGDNVTIGASSVILKNIESNTTVYNKNNLIMARKSF
jgi:serine O-acetyltransferase